MDEAVAQRFAHAIREAWLTGKDFEGEKKKGFFISRNRGFDDKLYVGNIHRIEDHLYWNDEELQEDDQIVDVVVIDGPVTRDGDGCSYGSKDHRDQILYANTIPQVVGHIFIINTPGGAASARIDYEQAIADCREKGKPTVAWVDGLCCSAGQLVAALCDRTVVMNGRHTMGCIGTMCAFWAVPHDNVDKDGYRYIELVSVTSPDKNAEYRDAAKGDYEKLQAELNRLGEEFRETVRQNRPLVKEEHLTGKTFDADSVMGALVDEIGDYNRAIECVFELAGQTLTAARLVTATEDPAGGEPSEEPEEMAKLNDQQKQAIANSRGDLMMADDGHVTTEKQGFFGPETLEVATPKNENTMTEKKKSAEAAEQSAAMQEGRVPATEQSAEEATATEASAAEEQSAEEAHAANTEGAHAANTEESPSDGGESGEESVGEKDSTQEEAPAAADESAGRSEALAAAEALVAVRDKEIAELKESLAALEGIAEDRDERVKELNTALSDIAENDKTIETHVATIAARDKTIAEHVATIAAKDATIEKLTKQVAELQSEVKELSERPAPMVSAESGVPADNSTGEAPQQKQRNRIQSGMTYEEIRRKMKEGKA